MPLKRILMIIIALFLLLINLVVFTHAQERQWFYVDVALSPDGTHLAVSNQSGVKLYDIQNPDAEPRQLHDSDLTHLTFSPDGRLLVASGGQYDGDGTLYIWDGMTGDEKALLLKHQGGVGAIQFNANSTKLASASLDKTIVWDVSGDSIVKESAFEYGDEFNDTAHIIRGVLFNPEGKVLVGIGDWGFVGTVVVQFIQVDTVEVISTVRHDSSLLSMASTPDGKLAVTGTVSGSVHLWNPASGEEIFRLAEQENKQNDRDGVAFSFDGSVIAASGRNGVASVWQADTGAEITRLEGRNAPMNAVALNKDGSILAAGYEDGTVYVWNVSSGEPVRVILP